MVYIEDWKKLSDCLEHIINGLKNLHAVYILKETRTLWLGKQYVTRYELLATH